VKRLHEKLLTEEKEEKEEEEEKEPKQRVKKEGIARQFQRFGHFVTNDHPQYEPADNAVKEPNGG
jgi:hypothetical protein